VSYPHPVSPQDGDIFITEVNAVSGDNTVLKKAQLLQMFYRGTTVVAPALFYLVRGLGQMNLQRAFCLRASSITRRR